MAHKQIHLSLRVSPDEAARLDELAKARGLKGRGARSKVVRALINEASAPEDADGDDDQPPLADEREVHQLLTEQARAGNVAAMHELRMLLRTPPADAGGRRDEPKGKQAKKPAPRDGFEKLDQLAERRAKRSRRAG